MELPLPYGYQQPQPPQLLPHPHPPPQSLFAQQPPQFPHPPQHTNKRIRMIHQQELFEQNMICFLRCFYLS